MMQPKICPSCGAGIQPDSQGGLHCTGCGAVVAEPFGLCPRCGGVNKPGEAECAECGTELTTGCPGCGRINWSGTERCTECGRELDPLAHAFRTPSASFELRQEDLRRRSASLRETAEEESRTRLEVLREADRRRIQRATERAEQARKRGQQIILGTGIAVAIFVFLLVLAALLLK